MDSHLAGQISGVALVSQPHKKATIIGALAASGKHSNNETININV